MPNPNPSPQFIKAYPSFQDLRKHISDCHDCHWLCTCEVCVEQLIHSRHSLNLCAEGAMLLQPAIKDYQFLSVCSRLDGTSSS